MLSITHNDVVVVDKLARKEGLNRESTRLIQLQQYAQQLHEKKAYVVDGFAQRHVNGRHLCEAEHKRQRRAELKADARELA